MSKIVEVIKNKKVIVGIVLAIGAIGGVILGKNLIGRNHLETEGSEPDEDVESEE